MYSEEFKKSLEAVEENRSENLSFEPERMTAKQKEKLLSAFHPDYKKSEFSRLSVGKNKGDFVPKELAKLLEGKGAWRVHGGGFAGCVQALMPTDFFPTYRENMEKAFGGGSCREIRLV